MKKKSFIIVFFLLIIPITFCIIISLINLKEEDYKKTVNFNGDTVQRINTTSTAEPTIEKNLNYYINKNYTHIIFGAAGFVTIIVVLYACTGLIINNKKKKKLLKEEEEKKKHS